MGVNASVPGVFTVKTSRFVTAEKEIPALTVRANEAVVERVPVVVAVNSGVAWNVPRWSVTQRSG